MRYMHNDGGSFLRITNAVFLNIQMAGCRYIRPWQQPAIDHMTDKERYDQSQYGSFVKRHQH